MGSKIDGILELEVPVIVLLGERRMRLSDVLALAPGAIIELHKDADEPLELLVNNKRIGDGSAVKVGENFGIRVGHVGDLKDRIRAMGSPVQDAHGESVGSSGEMSADEAAEAAMMAMLAGQGA